MDRTQRNRTEWEDLRNWRAGWLGIYHSPIDDRLWVPKRRPGFGWTVNTARPAGIALLLGVPLLAAAIACALRRGR